MSIKKKSINKNIFLFIISFISFFVAWFFMWSLFLALEIGNGIAGHKTVVHNGMLSSNIYGLSLFVLPVLLAAVIVYFFTNGSFKKAIQATILASVLEFLILRIGWMLITKH